MNLNKDERKMLIELICNEQMHMIIKNQEKYNSKKYKKLEALKVKIKDLSTEEEEKNYYDNLRECYFS